MILAGIQSENKTAEAPGQTFGSFRRIFISLVSQLIPIAYSTNAAKIVATSARVMLPCGLSVPSS